MLKKFFKDIEKIFEYKKISGASEGEKGILTFLKGPSIFLCDNFAQAGKIKRALNLLSKNVEIISSAVDKEEGEVNMRPFVEGVCKFLCNKLDYLIFLPCSSIVKFDLSKFKEIKFNVGQEIDFNFLSSTLSQIGYQREDMVSQKGEFAIRGDILDIFPLTEETPVRIEFFGDEIESIHYFDIEKMQNIKSLQEISVFPSVLSYGENCCVDLCDSVILEQPEKFEQEIEFLMKSYKTLSYFDENNYAKFEKLYNKSSLIFDNLNDLKTNYKIQRIPTRNYLTDFLMLKNDILSFNQMNLKVVLFAGNEKYKKKLIDFCNDNLLVWRDFDNASEYKEGVYISEIDYPFSCSFLQENIVCIGSDSLFKHKTSSFSKSKHSVFYLPKLGDYVVHSFHGIGKCIKIERMKIADVEKDYFVIEYKNGGVLYLPSEETNSLSAYIGGETQPKLSSLGGAEFARLKERVKQSIKEMAFSLAEIYKERQERKGLKFVRDEFLEKQFADAFPFQLSLDQEKAIMDIDKDMEEGKIMERLVCGDVGFGKTEVAMRAIFKCVYNGKQACVLCPTTILSQQHYNTLKKRFDGFGVNIEVINRFKSSLQVKDILRRLKEGQVDVLIGTHRLLSNDVIYKDLGLLVLDEEHRFGVEHKEKLKNICRNVNVLTLSATPIPRTLNMSLSGIRDISIIETPPKDRLPIQTYLAEFDDQLLKDVLSREMARGGISFVIYNRVETIEEFASYVRNLMPDARVGISHGQMQEKQLEKVIERLYDGEFDILISTTLIENGIDLAKANTMVVVDADKLGLSTLYQLRGRIGRSDKLSYAYLTYTKDKVLTEQSVKRLEALKEFSTLGSGFKIAMRDLEIRGAGNIFGKQQHGHIAKVGYDMYVKLLDEEVKLLKGEKAKRQSEVKLEILVDAYIDENYISSSEERIAYYSRIGEIESQNDVENLIKSLSDTFGFVPKEVANLCKLAYLRNLAGNFAVEKIKINNNTSELVLKRQENVIEQSLAKNLSKFNGKLSFDNNVKVVFNFDGNNTEKVEKMIDFFVCCLKNESEN